MTDTDTDLPRLTRPDLLAKALDIAREYHDDGLTLTLRQLYYQFVARGLVPNGQLSYKRIGDTLTDARYDGAFPPDWLEDRGREVTDGQATRRIPAVVRLDKDAVSMLHAIPRALVEVDRWIDQPWYVSAWVEKEALAGVFEEPCKRLGVSLFPCRGYPSVSALWDWLKKARAACDPALRRTAYNYPGGAEVVQHHWGTALRCVVLYWGDHDPDGLEIPESAERNLRRLMLLGGEEIDLTFRRVALTPEQIEEYQPPPFPAKETSSRFDAYVRRTGLHDAWELDALEPRVLRSLIEDTVGEYWDEAIHEAAVQEERHHRAALARRLPRLAADTFTPDDGEE
jgi:hypothetical protein